MKKQCLLIIGFVLFAIFNLNTSYALSGKPLEIQLTNNNITTHIESMVSYELIINNNQDTPDDFVISINGPHMEWMIPNVLLLPINATSSDRAYLRFYPTEDGIGDFVYNVNVYSNINPKINDSAEIHLNILPFFTIKDFYVDKVGNELNVNLEIDSAKNQNVDFTFEVNGRDNNIIIATLSTSVEVSKETNTISRTITLPDLLAGDYLVEVRVTPSVIGDELTDEARFTIEPVHNVVEAVEKESTVLYDEITVTVHNQGNVVERDYAVDQRVSNDFITGFITDPTDCFEEASGRNVCEYVIGELEPGEQTIISYRIEHWKSYIPYAVLVVIIIAIISLSFVKATNPKIKKRYVKKGDRKHSIILEIKNPFLHDLKNVIVRDWVSPLANVRLDEFEPMKPVVRKSDAGTELIWKLGNVRPKEHRILSYKINTMIEGSFKMPRAYARYSDDKGSMSRIYSSPIVVE
jgi:hypothetical protein